MSNHKIETVIATSNNKIEIKKYVPPFKEMTFMPLMVSFGKRCSSLLPHNLIKHGLISIKVYYIGLY